MPRLRSTIAGLLAAGGIVLSASSTPAATPAQPLTRTVYVTVTDREGAPITDLTTADFEVRYAGRTQEITDVKISTTPLRVAILVADRGTGIYQAGTLRFIEALLGRGEFSITGVVVQPERFVDYSSEVDALRGGLLRLQKRGASQAGAQLVDAIVEAAKEVPRDGYRPVIVVMRAGGEAPTPVRSEAVREEIRKSGAVLYAISRGGTQSLGGSANPTSPITAAGVSQSNAMSEQMEGALTLGTILGDGGKDSGGRHIQAVSTSVIETMQQIAKELLNQYQITYTIPQAGRPSDRLAVSVKRRGLTIAAPTRVPN